MNAKKESKSAEFLGETLFHFLGTRDDESLLEVFGSIVRRGLLLTVGNKGGKLDYFPVQMVGGTFERLEVMQHARVCFTDIPERLLSAHCREYGKFGIGFSRRTILEWGGNPVIYVPNHPNHNTLETSMATTLYCLHRVSPIVDRLKECLARLVPLDGEDGARFIEYMEQTEQSARRILGFVKEMSSQEKNDYQSLYEREWRIVDGVTKEGVEFTRGLSDDEYRELGKRCKRWTKPFEMSERLARKYPHTSMLQFFRFFDGLPGKTISQAIEVILVPSESTKQRVTAYIAGHLNKFRQGGPAIRVFGQQA
jgi:Putative abortive phage resistance protein AbiGi, antitoxin